MLQAIRKDRGGTIEAHFLGGRPGSVTVSVCKEDGTEKSAGSATLDAVNTTLSGAAVRGARVLTLTSVTGVVAGRRYLVGTTNGAEAPEAVTVKSVSGNQAALWAPLLLDHSSGAAFGGTRAYYDVPADDADETWWDGYADFVPNVGEVVTEVVECVLRPVPVRLIDETDLRAVFADADGILPPSLDLPLALIEARDELLRRLGRYTRVHSILGADHFRRPCALVFWRLRGHELGEPYAARMDNIGEELSIMLRDLTVEVPTDGDQNGATTGPGEGGYSSPPGDRT